MRNVERAAGWCIYILGQESREDTARLGQELGGSFKRVVKKECMINESRIMLYFYEKNSYLVYE